MLRPLTEADLPACVEILSTSDPWLRLGLGVDAHKANTRRALNDGLSWVAEEESKLIGFALVQPNFLGAHYLKNLAVHADHRKAGVGLRLLEQVEQQAFAHSPNIFLCVSSFNTHAQRFYLRHDYQVIGVIKDFFIATADEILMRKTRGPLKGYKP